MIDGGEGGEVAELSRLVSVKSLLLRMLRQLIAFKDDRLCYLYYAHLLFHWELCVMESNQSVSYIHHS